MAKGPIVTDAVEALIASVYQKHPQWKAPEVRNEVSFLLRKNNPELPSGWPSLSTVQKVLAIVRKKMKEKGTTVNPQDMLFNLGVVFEHKIPAEAIPMLLKMQLHELLSIRQARWASKLYIAAHECANETIGMNDELDFLYCMAAMYALREEAYEIIGKPCNTSDLDKLFIAHSVKTKEEATKLLDSIMQATQAASKDISEYREKRRVTGKGGKPK